MRLLRNVLLLCIPILIILNLWLFQSRGVNFEYRGFRYLHSYMQTFPGFQLFVQCLNDIDSNCTVLSNTIKDIHSGAPSDVIEWLQQIGYFLSTGLKIIGLALALIPMAVGDVIRNVLWFFNLFYLQ